MTKIPGLTKFFRDRRVWQMLKETVIPNIIRTREPGSILRAWVVGCSTGEETYSLAIVFNEVLRKISPKERISLQIYATDINDKSIDKARKGEYSNFLIDEWVSPERIKHYFIKLNKGYQVKSEIRTMVVFEYHDIINDPAYTNINLLLCRNVLIWMDPEVQRRAFKLFYDCIVPGGAAVIQDRVYYRKKDYLGLLEI